MIAAMLCLLLAQQPDAPAPAKADQRTSSPKAANADPVSQYLTDLEQSGVLATPAEVPSLPQLKETLHAAEDDLVTGNAQAATRACSESSNRRDRSSFEYAPEYETAELTLGRALVAPGGQRFGQAIPAARARSRRQHRLLRPRVPGPGRRGAGDAAKQAAILAALDGDQARGSAAARQRDRTRLSGGKVAYEKGDCRARRRPSRASIASRASTPPHSTSAASSQAPPAIGSRSARRNLCEIVEQADKDRFSFFIDGRYYAIKDLAYLALGRIAHEQGKYDDAYYFYFRVPEDSERLPDALFEAAWSMFQKGEYEAAGAFLEEFDRMFPGSPLAPDVMLLHAMIDLKSCQFEKVRTTLECSSRSTCRSRPRSRR